MQFPFWATTRATTNELTKSATTATTKPTIQSTQRILRFVVLLLFTTATTTLVRSLQQQHQPATQTSRNKMMRVSSAQLYEPFRKYPALFKGAPFNPDWVHNDLKQLVKLLKDSEKQAVAKVDQNDDPATKIGNDKQDDDDVKTNKRKNETSETTTTSAVVAKNIGVCTDKALTDKLLRYEAPEVYSFQCFNESFIKMFNEEIQNFYTKADEENIPIRRPNSMNNYGVIVNEIGMRPMITAFQQEYIWPLARNLFPKQGYQLDDHHAFIVRYQAGEDLGLDMHVDDSDVTFNVCMGDVFTGATLSFCGMFGAPSHRKLVHVYNHQVGRAVIHLGNRRHGADDIQEGTRSNLIIWNHNHDYRSSPEYKRRRQFDVYQKEEGPPDPVCVSFTHDRDYLAYRGQLPRSQRHQHFHGWCPPPGKEYDDFPKGM